MLGVGRLLCYNSQLGQVAQLVEQRTENPCVGGSIPPLATRNTWPQQWCEQHRSRADEADLPVRSELRPRQPRPARCAIYPCRARTGADGGRRVPAGGDGQSRRWWMAGTDFRLLLLWRYTETASRRIVSRGAAFPWLRMVISTSQPSRVSRRIRRSTDTSRNCPLSSRETSG